MLTTARKSLSLSGGRIIIDQTVFPSYTPSGQHFPWEEEVDVINTPDIDPSFFNDDPFKKLSHNNMDYMEDKLELIIDQNCVNDDTSQHSNQQSFEDNVFIDLSQLISQTTSESLVSPNDVLQSAYLPSLPSTEPVLHYMETNKAVESIISSVSIPVITTKSTSLMPLIDSNSSHSHSHEESVPLSQSSHPPQSLSPMTSHSYTTPSPALSYTSTTSDSYYVPSVDELINTDSNTIDSLIETKPELSFLQPTVINDHLYTLPLNPPTSSSKRKRSTDSTKDNKYMTVRKKNNLASKKSRITKRDKQKLMEEQITRYVEDNQKCTEMIARMEKEIEWCKNYLFKKVVSASKS